MLLKLLTHPPTPLFSFVFFFKYVGSALVGDLVGTGVVSGVIVVGFVVVVGGVCNCG